MNCDIGINSQSWNGFSSDDLKAIRELYMSPTYVSAGSITGNVDPPIGVSSVYSISGYFGSDVGIEWSIYNMKGEEEGFVQYPSGLSTTVIFQKRGMFFFDCRFSSISTGWSLDSRSFGVYVDM